jgi:hypothetical protein
VTLEFPKSLNGEDVAIATNLCRALGVRQEIVTHDVVGFADDPLLTSMSQSLQCSQIAYLSVMRYVHWYEGDTIVMGGEILFQKHWNPATKEPDWYYVYREDEDAMTYRFSQHHSIPVINEYFSYTPELFYSWFNDPLVQEVFTNPYKLSMVSSKNRILTERYFKPQGIEPATTTKRHGYEQLLAFNELTQARLRSELIPPQDARIPISTVRSLYERARLPGTCEQLGVLGTNVERV